jgi:hypothetical protein
MKKICPFCETMREVAVVEKIERINICGEPIEALTHPFYCLACGEYFEDPMRGFDFLEKAYEEYRRRKALMQPQM